jgi:hypothetical protein
VPLPLPLPLTLTLTKVTGGYAEDAGFALGPNGVGWKKVGFDI